MMSRVCLEAFGTVASPSAAFVAAVSGAGSNFATTIRPSQQHSCRVFSSSLSTSIYHTRSHCPRKSIRNFSTSPARLEESPVEQQSQSQEDVVTGDAKYGGDAQKYTGQNVQPPASHTTPRWKETPPAMKAPVRLRHVPGKPEFRVNSDPLVLDRFYVQMLGQGGDKLLSEEVKWLAITHKSFDQGRRGFNDRLSYLGKQIVQLQASLALVEGSRGTGQANSRILEEPYEREPFRHPALEGIEILTTPKQPNQTAPHRLAGLAKSYGLPTVLRWLPMRPNNLAISGITYVLAESMYAIIGALAMERGGVVANELARERILKPLGFFGKV